MLTSNRLRRRLLRLIDVVCDEADRNPEFLAKLEQAWAGTGGSSPKRTREDAPDPFPVVSERGLDGLRTWLAALPVDQLREIVRAHRFDPSRLSDKWKSPERFIDLIMQRVAARTRQGEAFRTYDSGDVSVERDATIAIDVEAIQYTREYKAVFVQAALENRSNRPDTVKDALLKLGDKTYRPNRPPGNLSSESAEWFPPYSLRLDSWGAVRGTWYFGGRYGSDPIELEKKTTAKLMIVPVRGRVVELGIEIVPMFAPAEEKSK